MIPERLKGLSKRFEQFAELECRGSSSLYERICQGIASDPEILELTEHCRKGQPAPNLFLAAVHMLLLSGHLHPLMNYYSSITQAPSQDDDPYPSFRSFCLEHAKEVKELISNRIVQTNEVRRSACLLPVFCLVAERTSNMPLALVEVGASAGLNLLWERYAYDYGNGRIYGYKDSTVRIDCDLRSDGGFMVPESLPKVGQRIGIDLNPIDLSDEDKVMWLRALVWPEHEDRVKLLSRAIDLARRSPPRLIGGDANDLLPGVLGDVPQNSTLCIFHAHTLNQFSVESRQRLLSMITKEAAKRDVYLISMEGTARYRAVLELTTYRESRSNRELLAYCDSHGRWLEWLGPGESGCM